MPLDFSGTEEDLRSLTEVAGGPRCLSSAVKKAGWGFWGASSFQGGSGDSLTHGHAAADYKLEHAKHRFCADFEGIFGQHWEKKA